MDIFTEIDRMMDELPLEKPIAWWAVVMDAPRHWGVEEEYEGIYDSYKNVSGSFASHREAQEHADQLNR